MGASTPELQDRLPDTMGHMGLHHSLDLFWEHEEDLHHISQVVVTLSLINTYLCTQLCHKQWTFVIPTSSITVYWVKGFKPLDTASVDKPV